MSLFNQNNQVNHTGFYVGIGFAILVVLLSFYRFYVIRQRANSRRRPDSVVQIHPSPLANSVQRPMSTHLQPVMRPPHTMNTNHTWQAPAPPYSPPQTYLPPNFPPPTAQTYRPPPFPPPTANVNTSLNANPPLQSQMTPPSFPVPQNASVRHETSAAPSFPSPTVSSMTGPTSSPTSPAVNTSIILPLDSHGSLVDRMREVQNLMLEIHRLELESGRNNAEHIRELQRRVAELSTTDSTSSPTTDANHNPAINQDGSDAVPNNSQRNHTSLVTGDQRNPPPYSPPPRDQ